MAEKSRVGPHFNFAFKSFVMLLGCWKTSLLSIKIWGKWVVNVFSSFLQKRLILYRKYREIMIFSSFSRFWPLYNGNNPIKPGWRLFTIPRRLFQKKFFQQFSTILALWRHLDPQKRTFWAFWANFCRFSPIWRL